MRFMEAGEKWLPIWELGPGRSVNISPNVLLKKLSNSAHPKHFENLINTLSNHNNKAFIIITE